VLNISCKHAWNTRYMKRSKLNTGIPWATCCFGYVLFCCVFFVYSFVCSLRLFCFVLVLAVVLFLDCMLFCLRLNEFMKPTDSLPAYR